MVSVEQIVVATTALARIMYHVDGVKMVALNKDKPGLAVLRTDFLRTTAVPVALLATSLRVSTQPAGPMG